METALDLERLVLRFLINFAPGRIPTSELEIMVSKHPINQAPALMQHLQIKPSSVPLLYVYDVIIWNIWYNGMHSLFSLPKIGFIWSCLSFKANPEQCVLLVVQYSVLSMCLRL